MFRDDSRRWKYVPYNQSDGPTRAAFMEKAANLGLVSDGVQSRFVCGVCGTESSLNEIGASFGDQALGTPICPTADCMGIGWDYFSPTGSTA
jgi:hypothetical protein